jgi:succinate-semialdehyde dehydrogenase/glutarate-semialdehyde dehydrogenase
MINGKLYINGEFKDSIDKKTFDVIDPYTLKVIGKQADASEKDIKEAIDGAVESFKSWKKTSAYDRGKMLRKLHDMVLENEKELAEIITMEQGKPLSEAIGEVRYGASYIAWYAEEGIRVKGDVLSPTNTSMRMTVIKEPVGPVGIITPWNFPVSMFIRKMAPALAAGCTVIIKPAEETPLIAYKFFQLVDKAGFPKGVCQLLTGDPVKIGKMMMEEKGIRKISFTGSTEIGKLLMAQSADTLKKVSLELGGHAPLIVFNNADIDKAVEGTIASKFRNCGQVCIATNRVLVQRDIYDKYIEKLIDRVKGLKEGSGFSEADMGPVINEEGYKKVSGHVDDALNRGATLLVGGKGYRSENGSGGFMYTPTVLGNINEDMIIMKEETFGPVVPVSIFEKEEEGIKLANNSPYGLSAYVFTENINQGIRVCEALEYGMVGLNTGRISSAQAPFGGIKMSGFGREGGYYGIEEYLVTKYIGIGI